MSQLGTIAKDDNGIGIIHNGSRREGNAVNDYSLPSSVSYKSVNDAFKPATRRTW